MSSATLCMSSHYVRRHKRFAFSIILCPSLRNIGSLKKNYLHYDWCYIIPDNTSDQNVFTICLPLWITRHLLKKITFFKCRHSFLLKNMTISHCFSHNLSVFLNMNSIRRNHYSYEETKRQFTRQSSLFSYRGQNLRQRHDSFKGRTFSPIGKSQVRTGINVN